MWKILSATNWYRDLLEWIIYYQTVLSKEKTLMSSNVLTLHNLISPNSIFTGTSQQVQQSLSSLKEATVSRGDDDDS